MQTYSPFNLNRNQEPTGHSIPLSRRKRRVDRLANIMSLYDLVARRFFVFFFWCCEGVAVRNSHVILKIEA